MTSVRSWDDCRRLAGYRREHGEQDFMQIGFEEQVFDEAYDLLFVKPAY
jgi:hypothetical protein